MNDLIGQLRAALDARERVIKGSGVLGWLTYRNADGSMHYTTAASGGLVGEVDEYWIVDGKVATGYASAQAVFDEDDARRQVAAHREILELHCAYDEKYPQYCLPGRPQKTCVGCGFDTWGEEIVEDVNDCPTLLALAKGYGTEVEGND